MPENVAIWGFNTKKSLPSFKILPHEAVGG